MLGGSMKNISKSLAKVAIVFLATSMFAISTLAEIKIPEIKIARNYGGEMHDEFQHMIATEDGGYLAVGSTTGKGLVGTPHEWDNGGSERQDGLAIKFDAEGNIEWAYCYGGPEDSDTFLDVVERPEGGYVIVGISTNNSTYYQSSAIPNERPDEKNDTNGIVVVLDEHGAMIHAYAYGGKDVDQFHAIDVIPSGGYVVVGVSNGNSDMNAGDPQKNWGSADSTEYRDYDGILLVLDENADVILANNYGGMKFDWFHDVVALDDNEGFLVVGNSLGSSEMVGEHNWGNYGEPFRDAIVLKVNMDGEVLWANNYGGKGADDFLSVTKLPNKEGFLAVGTTTHESTMFGGDPVKDWNCQTQSMDRNDAIAVKLNYNGDVLWANNYGGSELDGFERIVTLANNEGYLIVGQSHGTSVTSGGDPIADWGSHGSPNMDAIAVKMNPDGTVAWAMNYGGYSMDAFIGVAVLKDSGDYVFAGITQEVSSMANGDPEKNWGYYGGSMDAIIVRLSIKDASTPPEPSIPPVTPPPVKPPVIPPTGVSASAGTWGITFGLAILAIIVINNKKED